MSATVGPRFDKSWPELYHVLTDFNCSGKDIERFIMELFLRFVPNAFKHGITEDEIWDLFLNYEVPPLIVRYKRDRRQQDIIYNAYGVTDGGRYLEIGYVQERAGQYRVIHAMDMRSSAKKRFKQIRRL